MKKIWSYLAIGFAFFAAGMAAMYKLMGDTVKINVQKVKNKRTSGITSTTIPINLESPKKRPKRTKKRKKQRNE